MTQEIPKKLGICVNLKSPEPQFIKAYMKIFEIEIVNRIC